jgi:hypothetical protein
MRKTRRVNNDTPYNQRCPLLLNKTRRMLDRIAEAPQIGIRASAYM